MNIDYSIINQVCRCPKRYELDLAATEPAPTSTALYLGSTFHLTQAVYFNSRLAGVELPVSDMLDIFNNFWYSLEGARGAPIFWGRDKPEDIAELGREMTKAYYPYAQRLKPLLVEYRLERDTPYGLVYGTIDLMTTSGLVIDWKTSAWFPYKTDIDRELQPTVYSFLLGGTVDFQYHYIIKLRLPVVRIYPTKRHNGDLTFFEKSLLPEIVKLIQTGLFPPLGRATGACRWCPYDSYCGET